MKKTLFRIMLLALGFSFLNCSSVKVITDKDPTVNFNEFKTYEFYGWAENSDQKLTRFDRERIERAFREEGRKRGLNRVESNGDLIVALNVVGQVKTQQTANTTTTAVGMNPGMGRGGMHRRGMRNPAWGWGVGHAHSTTVITESQYIEGSLIIEA